MDYRDLPDHPDIAETMRTGYPPWKSYADNFFCKCDACGENVYVDDVYEDEYYEHLCLQCLKRIHRKQVEWVDGLW